MTLITPARNRVFISYAHKDGMDFTRRLAFALEMYMDVFWDKELQAGDYPQELQDQIEKRDYFIFVMTHYSVASEWCQEELEIAKKSNRVIVPICIEKDKTDNKNFVDENLVTYVKGKEDPTYTYGNFVDDFEVGFRCITKMMLGTAYSSWEYLANNNNYNHAEPDSLPSAITKGYIPCLIVKQLASWLFAEKLWDILKIEFENANPIFAVAGHPRTASGFKKIGDDLLKTASQLRNAGFAKTTTDWMNQIIEFYQQLGILKDSQHPEAGRLMSQIIYDIYKHLEDDSVASRKASDVIAWRTYFHFDVYEKLRELITYYANTSRRLY